MRKGLIIAVVAIASLQAAFARNTDQGVCDRTCLENYVDRYMDAMLENDPGLDLFSRDCKFTENGVRHVRERRV